MNLPAWTRTFTARTYRWLGFITVAIAILAALYAAIA
jgi:hypothetical protein